MDNCIFVINFIHNLCNSCEQGEGKREEILGEGNKTLDFILLIQYKKDWRERGKISLPSKMFVKVCKFCGSGVGM